MENWKGQIKNSSVLFEEESFNFSTDRSFLFYSSLRTDFLDSGDIISTPHQYRVCEFGITGSLINHRFTKLPSRLLRAVHAWTSHLRKSWSCEQRAYAYFLDCRTNRS